MSITYDIIKSWSENSGINSTEKIKRWIDDRNKNLRVDIEKVDFSYDGFWYYDERLGRIRNINGSFFEISGYQEIEEDKIIGEQPIIIQDEIGYLGIICQKKNGILHFLMQAKIEPGNVNIIQISPTIQATKSNFTKKHGGKAPLYLDYFVNANQYTVLVDQLQSEQSSRFYKKRNRNMIILIDEDEVIDVGASHMWMTLGQIKELMTIDNLINMDTRTVLSNIVLDVFVDEVEKKEIKAMFKDEALFNSIFKPWDFDVSSRINTSINNYKMYKHEYSRLLPVKSLKGWDMNSKEIVCKTDYDFKVVYCRIEIEGREVQYWEQPLFEAIGQAVFGIFTTVEAGVRQFLVKVRHEIGCFDEAEISPVVQLEPSNKWNQLDDVERLFLDMMTQRESICFDVVLSEEGGRFFHEQNRNVMIEIEKKIIKELPEGYFWVDYATLSRYIQFNNWVNIQLRNLVSLIRI